MTNAPTTRETADHAELAQRAEAATPGPWYRGHNENGCAQGEMSVWPDEKMTGAIIAQCGHQAPWAGWFEQPAKDAAFIAAANPATVLALLSEIAALRGDLTVSRDDLDQLQAHFRQRDCEATQAERQRDELRKALDRQCDNMSFVLNRVELHAWADKFSREVAEDRALLANQGADKL